tara:strand:- start:152 stop:1051 length:900 start_codon:yes stop_codon:yes gene_type:complete
MTNKLKVTIESVSPDYAQILLDNHNTNNYRKVSESNVTNYANLMKQGQWLTEACTIVIDNQGVLTNGQHRLLAVLKAGTAIDMIIVRNADPRSRYVIDDHMPRRMKDHVGCEAYHITMINTFLRAESLHTNPKYCKNVDFYSNHVNGLMGELVTAFHSIFTRTDSPFTSYGMRAALIMAVLNEEITKDEALSIFEKMCVFRKYKNKKGDYIHAYQSSTRSSVQATLPKLMSKLVDKLDADVLPFYTGIASRWAEESYSTARDKAQKLMLASYQALCKGSRDSSTFKGAVSNQVCKALGI